MLLDKQSVPLGSPHCSDFPRFFSVRILILAHHLSTHSYIAIWLKKPHQRIYLGCWVLNLRVNDVSHLYNISFPFLLLSSHYNVEERHTPHHDVNVSFNANHLFYVYFRNSASTALESNASAWHDCTPGTTRPSLLWVPRRCKESSINWWRNQCSKNWASSKSSSLPVLLGEKTKNGPRQSRRK